MDENMNRKEREVREDKRRTLHSLRHFDKLNTGLCG